MSLYIKNGVVKSLHKIVLIKDDMQIFNPTIEMVKEDGWVEYIAKGFTEEELLIQDKNYIKNLILSYDSSDSVNIFYMNNQPIWLDKPTRTGLMLRFQAELGMGQTNTSLWYDGSEFILPLSMAIQMLYAIEIYASKCYDNTQKHLSDIDKITNVDDLKNYDYTTGYPEKLNFNN